MRFDGKAAAIDDHKNTRNRWRDDDDHADLLTRPWNARLAACHCACVTTLRYCMKNTDISQSRTSDSERHMYMGTTTYNSSKTVIGMIFQHVFYANHSN